MSDSLYQIAAAEGIGVSFASLPEPLLGLYDSQPGETPLKLLHEKTRYNRKLLRCILAEELGHHFTGGTNMMVFAISERHVYNKYDRLAL